MSEDFQTQLPFVPPHSDRQDYEPTAIPMTLWGSLDEFTELDQPQGADLAIVRLDLSGLVKINSAGIRRLIIWLRSLNGKTVEFHACPPAFIQHALMIPDLSGAGTLNCRIASILLDCRCDECGLESRPLFHVTGLACGALESLTSPPCPRCGSTTKDALSLYRQCS